MQLLHRRIWRLRATNAAKKDVKPWQHMRIQHRFILCAGACNLGIELAKRLEMPKHGEERLVTVDLCAPTLFREGHKNSPEKELQKTQRPHAATPVWRAARLLGHVDLL
jgi:hypothetical protein